MAPPTPPPAPAPARRFTPSLLTGYVIKGLGAPLTMLGGALMLLAGNAAFFWTFSDLSAYFLGNAVVGLGWNWAYVGASAVLTTTYRPDERLMAQGVADACVMFGLGVSNVLAGVLYGSFGWGTLLAIFLVVNGTTVGLGAGYALRLYLPRLRRAFRRRRGRYGAGEGPQAAADGSGSGAPAMGKAGLGG